jgi:exodeoxyribonuclease V alpha subunit
MSEVVEGSVERITYSNGENGYTIARFVLAGSSRLCTLVGNMPGVSVGERLKVKGEWIKHPQFGLQFKVESYTSVLPATVDGIRRYLGSGLIRGVGPTTAERIVKHFGAEALRVIEEQPERLHEVPGVGGHRIALIKAAWAEQKQIKELMIFLQGHEVPLGVAARIFREYGDASLDVLRSDPYRLAREVRGIGFLTADRIARQLGMPGDSPQRIQAGISYVLSDMTSVGHVYLPEDELAAEATRILSVPQPAVQEAMELLRKNELTIVEDVPTEAGRQRAVYLPAFHRAETGVAAALRSFAGPPHLPFAETDPWDDIIRLGSWTDELHLSDTQRRAIRTALTHRLTVLTGGPGTGKTTTVRTLLRLVGQREGQCLLAAPTGRAAKRLAELAGTEARTVHRLLEFSPAGGQFQRHEGNPLEADMVIVDEASMLDLILAYHLLKAIPIRAHLLLVGDIDQLPPVGPGNVLSDLIASGQAPVVRLEQVFRQAHTSWIVENAHRINQGELPIVTQDSTDFFLFPTEDPERAAELVVDLVQNRIPDKFGYDPHGQIQVLSPMHRGEVGVDSLNERLQNALNPGRAGRAERREAGGIFRVGDRVMQTRNNYDKEVFNGDIGRIGRIDPEAGFLEVQFDERRVRYDYGESDELTLAYAISVHKSQGSEYPVVVLPLLTQHSMMLQRNLLYTAITRARKLVVLVGSRRAIRIAVENNRITRRNSALAARLRGLL